MVHLFASEVQRPKRWLQHALFTCLMVFGFLLISVASSWAGSIFITGHDPDFHAYGCFSIPCGTPPLHSEGAKHINQAAINYVTDPAFNPFTGLANKFLFAEAVPPFTPPPGHVDGRLGLIASGYVEGTDFEVHGLPDLEAELGLLGTKYNALVVASDSIGILTQRVLNILNARSADIVAFLNAGGGLYAMAESNSSGNPGVPLTPDGGHFGFLPFVVSSSGLFQSETGFTLTPFGASLGLSVDDINGNISHNIFGGTFGLNVVDYDDQGNIVSLAGRGIVTPAGVVSSSPVCSAAQAVPSALWPPNHKFVPVVVMGVTDPDGDSVTVTVTGVTQDEPVNSMFDGNTSPDAVIQTGGVLVRAERSGEGNGRVYQISFTAEDGKGGSCTGAVSVGVPHSQGEGVTAIDDGQVYDSTIP